MEQPNNSYDILECRDARLYLENLWIIWTIRYSGIGPHNLIKTGPHRIRIDTFSIMNINLSGYSFNIPIETSEKAEEQFEKYIIYHLHALSGELPTKRKSLKKPEYTTLIIDEFGIDKYTTKFEGINLFKLTPSQLKSRCETIANIFEKDGNAVYYVPEKFKSLPIKNILRVRKGIKLYSSPELSSYDIHDWGFGNVNCNPNEDEIKYFRLTNPNIHIPSYREICPYIDCCNSYFLKKKGDEFIASTYRCYYQKEGSDYYRKNDFRVTLNWEIEIYPERTKARKWMSEAISKSEEMERKRRELEWLEERRIEEERLAKFRYNKRNRHYRDSYISFDETNHTYIVDGNTLQSVTNIVENCFPKFDAELHAKYTAAKMGITPEEVIMMWEQKGKESRELGTVMHQKIESYYQGKDSKEDDSYRLFKMFTDKVKLEPYRTEWAVYDTDYNIAGTIDFVDYQDGKYTIYDWKRSDKIIANGMPVKVSKYQEKGVYPLEHLENCAYYHYALQLSLYKFILEKNYDIKVSDLRLGIFHPSYDKPYVLKMPYLENEVKTLMELRSEVIL